MVGEQQTINGHIKRMTETMYAPIARKLNEARIRQGMKKNYFCMMLCAKRRTIDRYFTGERTPNMVVLYLISRRLGFTLDELFDTQEINELYEEFIRNEELIDEVGLR